MLVRAVVQSSFDGHARQLHYVRLKALLGTVLDTRTLRPRERMGPFPFGRPIGEKRGDGFDVRSDAFDNPVISVT